MKSRVVVKAGAKDFRIKMDATAMVKWENRAAAAKKPLPEYLSLFLNGRVQRTH